LRGRLVALDARSDGHDQVAKRKGGRTRLQPDHDALAKIDPINCG